MSTPGETDEGNPSFESKSFVETLDKTLEWVILSENSKA